MKIMTWNVRGSGSYRKRRSIKQVIDKEDPDIVVLQEVKKQQVNRRFMGSLWRSCCKEWILLPTIGRAGVSYYCGILEESECQKIWSETFPYPSV